MHARESIDRTRIARMRATAVLVYADHTAGPDATRSAALLDVCIFTFFEFQIYTACHCISASFWQGTRAMRKASHCFQGNQMTAQTRQLASCGPELSSDTKIDAMRYCKPKVHFQVVGKLLFPCAL